MLRVTQDELAKWGVVVQLKSGSRQRLPPMWCWNVEFSHWTELVEFKIGLIDVNLGMFDRNSLAIWTWVYWHKKWENASRVARLLKTVKDLIKAWPLTCSIGEKAASNKYLIFLHRLKNLVMSQQTVEPTNGSMPEFEVAMPGFKKYSIPQFAHFWVWIPFLRNRINENVIFLMQCNGPPCLSICHQRAVHKRKIS